MAGIFHTGTAHGLLSLHESSVRSAGPILADYAQSMMPVLCVLDANVIIADRRLGSASARTITSMAEAGLIRLAIPEVAFKEVVQNSLEVLDKARRDLKAVRRSIMKSAARQAFGLRARSVCSPSPKKICLKKPTLAFSASARLPV